MSTPLPANKRRIKELLKKEQFDVLHVQLPFSPFMAGRVIRYAPKTTAIIGTFHILPFSRLESLATRLLGIKERRRIKRFDKVVSVSAPAAKFASKAFRVKSVVVPNAVLVSRFQAGKPSRKLSSGKINIVYLGRLVERKGCMHLLKAIEVLKEQNLHHNIRVIIASKGPLESELKSFVHEKRMGKFVQFTGYISEEKKPDLLAAADIAVFPSTGGESFGIVLVEAMAAGADVVIAGMNPGYASVMYERKDQLINPADTKAFAKTLKKFLISSHARSSAKKWQSNKVKEYDVRVVGNKLEDIYAEALRSKMKAKK
jgi:phosphatidylinositol alpha-mannosyltransferase